MVARLVSCCCGDSQLLLRLAELGGAAAVQAMDLLESGNPSLTPQEEALATYARKLSKADGWLDWTQPAAALALQVRALTPWPGAHTSLPDGRKLGVLEARPTASVEGAAGCLVSSSGLPVVCAGEGTGLELVQVKPEGRGTMDGASFLRGARLPDPAQLGGA